MHPDERATARRSLDRRLNQLREHQAFERPPRGWIRAIRNALGMTSAQLAKRLGVVQSRVTAMEQAEMRQTLTLASLAKAAQAMDCQLVYALVPREPLEKLVKNRARLKAKEALNHISHSMVLEAQSVAETDEQEQLERMTREMIGGAGPSLWKDDD
jgi:predicted DNA-binding mobile mystery protein A